MRDRVNTPIANAAAAPSAPAEAPPSASKSRRSSSLSRAWWCWWNSFLIWWHTPADNYRSRSAQRRPAGKVVKSWRAFKGRLAGSALGKRFGLLVDRFYAWWYPVLDEPGGHAAYVVRRRKSRPGVVWHRLKRHVQTLPQFNRTKSAPEPGPDRTNGSAQLPEAD